MEIKRQALNKRWSMLPLPDGSIRLTWSIQRHLAKRGMSLTVCSMFAAAALWSVFALLEGPLMKDGMPMPAWQRNAMVLFASLCFLGFCGAGIWGVFGWEEMRVGPNFVEIYRSLFGFGRKHRLESGTFWVITTRTRGRWNLWSALTSDDPYSTDEHSLILRSKREGYTLDKHGAVSEFQTLGRFLASTTGWKLRNHRKVEIS